MLHLVLSAPAAAAAAVTTTMMLRAFHAQYTPSTRDSTRQLHRVSVGGVYWAPVSTLHSPM